MATMQGSEVRELQLGQLTFEPIRCKGYSTLQVLEPDLSKAQQLIKCSNHIVFVYPNWWRVMPALMKGFSTAFCFPVLLFSIARVLSSGINYFQGGQAAYGNNGYAGLVLSLDISPAWTSSNEKTIFGFCGIKVLKISVFAAVKGSSQQQREIWLHMAKELGQKPDSRFSAVISVAEK